MSFNINTFRLIFANLYALALVLGHRWAIEVFEMKVRPVRWTTTLVKKVAAAKEWAGDRDPFQYDWDEFGCWFSSRSENTMFFVDAKNVVIERAEDGSKAIMDGNTILLECIDPVEFLTMAKMARSFCKERGWNWNVPTQFHGQKALENFLREEWSAQMALAINGSHPAQDHLVQIAKWSNEFHTKGVWNS